jgi:hypothetical protein
MRTKDDKPRVHVSGGARQQGRRQTQAGAAHALLEVSAEAALEHVSPVKPVRGGGVHTVKCDALRKLVRELVLSLVRRQTMESRFCWFQATLTQACQGAGINVTVL